MKNSVYILLAVVIVVVGGFVIYLTRSVSPNTSVPRQAEFAEKIVYTTDASADTTPLKADCASRKGVFNECGNICAPDAEICASVCAFTCDLKKVD
ncbi:hypothetical protein HYT01_03280 [Candidatus Giovannonibacteria bacterium]|nr:hypothetical protein [Candidatus Giovannonibacteria bacterium]